MSTSGRYTLVDVQELAGLRKGSSKLISECEMLREKHAELTKQLDFSHQRVADLIDHNARLQDRHEARCTELEARRRRAQEFGKAFFLRCVAHKNNARQALAQVATVRFENTALAAQLASSQQKVADLETFHLPMIEQTAARSHAAIRAAVDELNTKSRHLADLEAQHRKTIEAIEAQHRESVAMLEKRLENEITRHRETGAALCKAQDELAVKIGELAMSRWARKVLEENLAKERAQSEARAACAFGVDAGSNDSTLITNALFGRTFSFRWVDEVFPPTPDGANCP